MLDRQLEARTMARRGFVTVALIPPAISVGILLSAWLDAATPIVLAGLYTFFGGLAGATWLGVGLFRGHRAKRQLDELLDEAIPRARLLT